MTKPTLATTLALMVSSILAGCTHNIRTEYQEPVIDRVTEAPVERPAWLRKTPSEPGRMYLVTTSTEGLSAESGVRLAKAYALAQLAEQVNTSVKVEATASSRAGLKESITWNAQSAFRSLRQDEVYWEKRLTQEGQRYSVWVLWSIPEKAFYESQQDVLGAVR